MLYVINLIVPLFFLLMLDMASFFISDNSGEKLGFKVTVLLSISVLLLILKDILPSTEDALPMIGEKKTPSFHCHKCPGNAGLSSCIGVCRSALNLPSHFGFCSCQCFTGDGD